jgi:mono/diheme cytochrome c family protein
MMSVLRITRDVALSLAGLALLAGVILYFATRPSEVIAVEGRDLYMRYCASCHGISATGDGPVAAALEPRPADLTRLTQATATLRPSGKPSRRSMAVSRSAPMVPLPCRCGGRLSNAR